MADANPAGEQPAHARLVLYQVSLGLVLVAINHRAIQVALPTLTHVFRADLSFIQLACRLKPRLQVFQSVLSLRANVL